MEPDERTRKPPREPRDKPPVVVVTGPTASGKTPVAIEIAQRFGGEIVNADSMQVYRYMDIGTAKPSLEQRERVPHHLLDVVTPDVGYSAGRYAEEARKVAAGIHAAGKIVVLTGGTGLYIRAFLEGLLEAGEADPELRAALESENRAALAAGDPLRLHRRLGDVDPETPRELPHRGHRADASRRAAGSLGEARRPARCAVRQSAARAAVAQTRQSPDPVGRPFARRSRWRREER